MADEPTAEPQPPRRRTLYRTLTVLGVLVVAAGSFVAGRVTAPEGADVEQANACADARAALKRATGPDAGTEGSDGGGGNHLAAANIIVQNPDCFEPEVLSSARTLLDGQR